MKSFLFLLIASVCTATPVYAEVIKKSKSGICHDTHSAYYERTKTFTEYGSLAACLDTGGRLPRSYSGPGAKVGTSAQAAMKEAQAEGRDYIQVYDRDAYRHWIDKDGDCVDERHELLIDTSTTRVSFTDSSQCLVSSGRWYDPYTARAYTDASDLHIDHIVSLSYAHQRGAHAWSPDRKERFANDRDNLLAVESGTNQQSDRGPSEWLPPNKQYRCEFLAKFDAVMDKYGLPYLSGERRVINRMKTACQ